MSVPAQDLQMDHIFSFILHIFLQMFYGKQGWGLQRKTVMAYVL